MCHLFYSNTRMRILGRYRECDDTIAGAVLMAFSSAHVDALAVVRSGPPGVAIEGTFAIWRQETHFANGLAQEEAGVVRSADERLCRQVAHQLRVAFLFHYQRVLLVVLLVVLVVQIA